MGGVIDYYTTGTFRNISNSLDNLKLDKLYGKKLTSIPEQVWWGFRKKVFLDEPFNDPPVGCQMITMSSNIKHSVS